jgi:hypothetical protein
MVKSIYKTITHENENLEFEVGYIQAKDGLPWTHKLMCYINRATEKVSNLGAEKDPNIMMFKAVSTLFSSLEPSEVLEIQNFMKEHVAFKDASGVFVPLKNPLTFEDAFQGRLDVLFKVLSEFLVANFLGSMRTQLEKLVIKKS